MITREIIGYEQGEPVVRYTLQNAAGASVQLLNYGARLTAIHVPDRQGRFENVILSYPHWQQYIDDPYYFGAVIGRYANRIRQSRFTIGDKRYFLKHNEGLHHLHGGPDGFSFRFWQEEALQHDMNSLTLSLESVSGEGGYPGALKVYLSFTWTEENTLLAEFTANTDETTVLNLTLHPYFNLSGDPAKSVGSHHLQMHSAHILETDQALLPTGTLVPLAASEVFGFADLTELGKKLTHHKNALANTHGGYDHTYLLAHGKGLTEAARLLHQPSGRRLKVITDYPAVQLYTSQWLNAEQQVPDAPWKPFSAVCIEPQYLPDAPNVSSFDTPLLEPDELYQHRIAYQFDVQEEESPK
ncbi:MAG: aldose epimerase family protein [Bacteroidales bacterium]